MTTGNLTLPPKPVPIEPQFERIPEELRERQQWITWRYVPDGKKWTKVPFDPLTGAPAKSTDSETWRSFECAVDAYQQLYDGPRPYDGVGYVFSADDPYCGADLDHCFEQVEGQLSFKVDAARWIEIFSSYTEYSVSGEGLHVIMRAKPSRNFKNDKAGHELYDRTRYFIFTGASYHEDPLPIADRQEQAEAFIAEYAPRRDTARESAARPTSSVAGQFRTWDELRTELGRRIATHESARPNPKGNIDCRGICHDGEGSTGLYYSPSKNTAHCNKGCDQATILQAFGLPAEPDFGRAHPSNSERPQAADTSNSEPARPAEGKGSPALNGQAPSFEPPSPRDPGDKVSIDVSYNHLPTMHALCWEAIKRENKPPILFRYGNTIVRAAKSDDGGSWLQIVTPEIMRHHLSNWAHWHKDEIKLAKPPVDVIKDVLAPLEIPLPPLRRVVTVPVFAPDGSLRLDPGYNESSGVLYAPATGFTALPVPDHVTGEDVDEANQLLCGEVLVDFPFASVADRDNAVALFLLPFCRDLIDGPTPNHLIEASMPGSGKGKLADALLLPSVGADLGLITPPRDEDEWRKQITSALIAGKQVILIDNVIHRLDSSALAAAWTGNVWDDRILGQKEKANIPIRCVWVMTGNNVAVSTELARRCVRMRLTPLTDRPEERTNFRHADLLLWCAEHRAELVRAAHVIIKWWVQQGMLPAKNPRPLGSYERWTRVIGGILEAAGYQKFLVNYREFQTKADTERTARALFCATWYEWSQMEPGRETVVTSQLLPIAEGVEGLPIKGSTERALQTSLGIWLRANADVIVEHSEQLDSERTLTRHFRILADKAKAGKQPWIIEKLLDEVHEVHESG